MSPLKNHHTFGLLSTALDVISITSVNELKSSLLAAQSHPYLILGQGSNTVFLEDYAGTILKMAIEGIELEQTKEHYLLTVGAGENWHDLVKWCLAHNIYGLENLALIPGTVGAAPIQNIGAYGVEVERFIESVSYFCLRSEKVETITHEECFFSYRDSIFKHALSEQVIITEVTFSIPKIWIAVSNYGELQQLDNPTAQEIYNKVVDVRQAKLPDPKKQGNAGSFFKNPVITIKKLARLKKSWPMIPSYPVDELRVKVPAAWLIDTLGFKGKKLGGISCHVTQPLVLTNDGTGTGVELLALARQIKDRVQQEFSITLENEVRLMGDKSLVEL
ncbi:UDP-N-acetylmuramate dehydrogenase [Paraglaciecola sp.]|uniref:UDP-N-acetylmuramate dehydrogenase n=1 Tax=Paraglaciecola sp. TaxID=1920173 RepID=UPI003EF9C06C